MDWIAWHPPPCSGAPSVLRSFRKDGMMTPEKGSVIAAVCRALADGATDQAVSILQRDYPFAPQPVTRRRFRYVAYTKAFVRDGFIDLYTGNRLIFPPVLRVLSFALPGCFPYHPNWKTDVTHRAYWELGATVDHLLPVSRGGADDLSNYVTTSMARNSAKMNWTLEELGWNLHPAGRMQEWDGLLPWFLEYTATHPGSIVDNAVRQWRLAAEAAVSAK